MAPVQDSVCYVKERDWLHNHKNHKLITHISFTELGQIISCDLLVIATLIEGKRPRYHPSNKTADRSDQQSNNSGYCWENCMLWTFTTKTNVIMLFILFSLKLPCRFRIVSKWIWCEGRLWKYAKAIFYLKSAETNNIPQSKTYKNLPSAFHTSNHCWYFLAI